MSKSEGSTFTPNELAAPQQPSSQWKFWREARVMELEPYYCYWVSHLTSEGLHDKADIATVLAILHQQRDEMQDDALRLHRDKMDLLDKSLATPSESEQIFPADERGLADKRLGLPAILEEASAIISGERPKREPIVDELLGFASMVRATPSAEGRTLALSGEARIEALKQYLRDAIADAYPSVDDDRREDRWAYLDELCRAALSTPQSATERRHGPVDRRQNDPLAPNAPYRRMSAGRRSGDAERREAMLAPADRGNDHG
jgi:hypothetical protein